ncbi:hypothetical protein Q7P36_003015 [Cladosporium allicinum]
MHIYQHLVTSSLVIGSVYAQSRYAANTVPLYDEPEVVAANFQDPNVELYSPAFLFPDSVPDEFANGTSGPTSQALLEGFLRGLADRNSWMTYNTPNFTSEEGRSIPYVWLSNTEGFNGSSSDKLRIYVHGAVHGNEPGGDQAVMAFLGKLDNNATWAEEVLEKADFLIIPRYNPDGVAYFQRYFATGFDPNRDHVKLARQQTLDIKAMNVAWDAHVSVDCHEYGARPLVNNTLLSAQDGQFSAFKNMNTHPRIRALAEGLFRDEIAAAIDANNLTHGPYVVIPSQSPLRLNEFITDNNGEDQIALSQGISYLSETRGIGLADSHFARRTLAGLTIIEAVVQTAVDNAEEVLTLIEDARAEYATTDAEIIVTSMPNVTNMTWPFISIANGSILEVPVIFGNNSPAIANLTRPRPEAYVFSGAWSEVASKLRATGVQVEVLEDGFEGEVEALNITVANLATIKFEGVAQTTGIETEMSLRNMNFPAGAFWVSSRQRRAAHAFMRLEPEAESSFAVWNVLPVAVGDEYPVYRVPRKAKGGGRYM